MTSLNAIASEAANATRSAVRGHVEKSTTRIIEEAISASKQEKWCALCVKLDSRRETSQYWNFIKVLSKHQQHKTEHSAIKCHPHQYVVQILEQTKKQQACLQSNTKTQVN
ncbi:hypothetical protein TNCV_1122611 [Trichonephila clavipes]|uniref:Uncharacterized protein n=1 Tax=Trichonephila clavipes TaxID=2585209 RepID=A0A8X6SFY1_TRICX|nr:hypothetical protein TNCV_1122611 [Trichonephila clavipes]